MSRLLYIVASPRGQRSHSVAVAEAFVEQWRTANPDGEVVVKNLFEADLPPFDGMRLQAKYSIMHGQEHSMEEKQAWTEVEALIDEFKGFDRYAFAVPMWNFAIPYRLKQYIDIIVQPGYTFGVNDMGYYGLLEDRKAFVAYASGGVYEVGNPMETFDFQSTYLASILGFIGITDVVASEVRGTLMEGAEARRTEAISHARALADEF